MTYCDNQWISDFTYEALLNWFQGKGGSAAAGVDASAAVDRLLVTGHIDPATNEVTLEPMYVIPDAPEIEPCVPGPYAIVLRGARGDELARYPFTPVDVDGEPTLIAAEPDLHLLGISEFVPYVAGAVRIDIEGPGSVVLKTVTAGANPPAVALTSPGGGILSADPVTVSWTASDPDGDPLTFAVQYTPDDGATWPMVSQSTTETSVQIPRANLTAGTAGRFRVWASDGIHTATAVSNPPFTVPNAPPEVRIVEPDADFTIMVGQGLSLRAIAYDADTGSLDNAQVEWASNLDGPLGTGAQTVALLGVGTHTITVTAWDTEDDSASDIVRVQVLPETEILPPPPVFVPIIMR